MKTYTKAEIARIASQKFGVPIPDSWTGIDPVLPLLERMREDGAVVLVKWDGDRRVAQGESPYTAVVQGTPLGDDFFRTDAATLEAALCHIIGHYSEHVWK
jgi:hypothetical protein